MQEEVSKPGIKDKSKTNNRQDCIQFCTVGWGLIRFSCQKCLARENTEQVNGSAKLRITQPVPGFHTSSLVVETKNKPLGDLRSQLALVG